MAERLTAQIESEHPDFVELRYLLNLAAETWPRWGLSVAELSQLDEYTLQMLAIAVTNG